MAEVLELNRRRRRTRAAARPRRRTVRHVVHHRRRRNPVLVKRRRRRRRNPSLRKAYRRTRAAIGRVDWKKLAMTGAIAGACDVAGTMIVDKFLPADFGLKVTGQQDITRKVAQAAALGVGGLLVRRFVSPKYGNYVLIAAGIRLGTNLMIEYGKPLVQKLVDMIPSLGAKALPAPAAFTTENPAVIAGIGRFERSIATSPYAVSAY